MKLISIFLVVSMTGCASLSERGAISETIINMPDGKAQVVWERTKINLFVPSTHIIRTYDCKTPGCVEVDNSPMLTQRGVGNDTVIELIRGASFVGGLVYSADKGVEAAKAIGDGLAASGDDIEVNNSNKIKNSNKNYNKNINHNKIKIDTGVKKRRWKH